MRIPGEMNLQGLALLGNLPGAGEGAATLATRMFDTDGDGRNDLFVADFDGDGTIDGVIRGLDLDGDGLSETFIQYDEDGEVQAVGRLDPESREFEVTYEDASDFEDLVSSLGLADLSAPDEALFTSFDDTFFTDSYGTQGDEVPDAAEDGGLVADAEISEVDEEELESMEMGTAVTDEAETQASSGTSTEASDAGSPGRSADASATGEKETESELPEVTPRVVEIEDWSGAGDGSDLHAQIDRDGDGLADDDERLFRTSDGTWHGDVNKDGYSDEVAFDRDQDGRVESVDTTGQGSSTDRVGAEQVVSPESGNIVDRHPGEDDFKVETDQATAEASPGSETPEASAEDWQVTDDDGSAGVLADESSGAASDDTEDDFAPSGLDSGSADAADDSGSIYDSGSTTSSVDDDSDVGSTTTDSGPNDSGDTDTT